MERNLSLALPGNLLSLPGKVIASSCTFVTTLAIGKRPFP